MGLDAGGLLGVRQSILKSLRNSNFKRETYKPTYKPPAYTKSCGGCPLPTTQAPCPALPSKHPGLAAGAPFAVTFRPVHAQDHNHAAGSEGARQACPPGGARWRHHLGCALRSHLRHRAGIRGGSAGGSRCGHVREDGHLPRGTRRHARVAGKDCGRAYCAEAGFQAGVISRPGTVFFPHLTSRVRLADKQRFGCPGRAYGRKAKVDASDLNWI